MSQSLNDIPRATLFPTSLASPVPNTSDASSFLNPASKHVQDQASQPIQLSVPTDLDSFHLPASSSQTSSLQLVVDILPVSTINSHPM